MLVTCDSSLIRVKSTQNEETIKETNKQINDETIHVSAPKLLTSCISNKPKKQTHIMSIDTYN